MVHKINPKEADIVKRIYKEFIGGKSISKIVKELNNDKVPTKKGYSGGWNTSTISRILKNEKYSGLWICREKGDIVGGLAVDGGTSVSDFFEVVNEHYCYWTGFSRTYHLTININ